MSTSGDGDLNSNSENRQLFAMARRSVVLDVKSTDSSDK